MNIETVLLMSYWAIGAVTALYEVNNYKEGDLKGSKIILYPFFVMMCWPVAVVVELGDLIDKLRID